ncbi:UBP1-associated protein 2A-like [Quercus robur]|uniref:UBP1-associated protein 2A-like n=1 Tax=Quercus robur TaxID=38942 RepID=UPI002161798F|nr:UBP1-associated protein 2A-like [Quercus robur]
MISSKNKNTNTNPATDLPCQPNTKATNTNPATNDDEDEDVEKLLEPFTKDHLVALIKKGVSKHPELIEIVRELADADPAHHKIFIHSLNWDTTVETLTSIFGKYGKIEDCKVVTDRVSGKSKGYAFILFKHQSDAWKALKQPQKQIGNRTTPLPRPMATPISC